MCNSCGIRFPVRDGIPVMLEDEALDLKSGGDTAGSKTPRRPSAKFKVIDGPDTNMTFQLEVSTCRAIGRATVDPQKTAVFGVDIALELDETTKRLIQQYVAKQFAAAKGVPPKPAGETEFFKRMGDLILTDAGLSRLHAMIFHDESGVGILDLVSKNGTFVNGKEIESKLLAKGDAIELGETTILFEE